MRANHWADLRAEYFVRMQAFHRSSLERAAFVFTQGMERRNAQGRLAACALFDQVEHTAEGFFTRNDALDGFDFAAADFEQRFDVERRA